MHLTLPDIYGVTLSFRVFARAPKKHAGLFCDDAVDEILDQIRQQPEITTCEIEVDRRFRRRQFILQKKRLLDACRSGSPKKRNCRRQSTMAVTAANVDYDKSASE